MGWGQGQCGGSPGWARGRGRQGKASLTVRVWPGPWEAREVEQFSVLGSLRVHVRGDRPDRLLLPQWEGLPPISRGRPCTKGPSP